MSLALQWHEVTHMTGIITSQPSQTGHYCNVRRQDSISLGNWPQAKCYLLNLTAGEFKWYHLSNSMMIQPWIGEDRINKKNLANARCIKTVLSHGIIWANVDQVSWGHVVEGQDASSTQDQQLLSQPAIFCIFLYKSMFKFYKILMRTNIFSSAWTLEWGASNLEQWNNQKQMFIMR